MEAPEPARVVAASNAWVWWPPEAEVVETEDYLLVRFPDHFDDPVQVLRTAGGRPAAELVAEVAERVRRWQRAEVLWWVKLDAPPDLEAALRTGDDPAESLAVLARALDDGGPDLDVPAEVEVRLVDDAELVRAVQVLDVAVFGGAVPPEEDLAVAVARARDGIASGAYVRFAALLDGEVVGSGGLSSVDGAARLWGGGVAERARGRGVYRAVLDARLRHAVEYGDRLALVKGRLATSAPILRRAGFTAYGEERAYRVPV